MGSPNEQLQLEGVTLLARHFPRQAAPVLTEAFDRTEFLRVRQSCIRALGRLDQAAAYDWLATLADKIIDGSLDARLELDVVESMQQAGEADKAKRSSLLRRDTQLQEVATRRSVENPANAKYAFSRDGGDPESGRLIFNTNVTAQCVRCHGIGREGSNVGPELTKIASARDPDHILRAIVSPSADIDPIYKTTAFVLDSGAVLSGVIQSDTDDEIVIADVTGKLIKIDVHEIEDQVEQKVSLMPQMQEVLSAAQVRDLVGYLRSLN